MNNQETLHLEFGNMSIDISTRFPGQSSGQNRSTPQLQPQTQSIGAGQLTQNNGGNRANTGNRQNTGGRRPIASTRGSNTGGGKSSVVDDGRGQVKSTTDKRLKENRNKAQGQPGQQAQP